jgi:hypothetical protein
VRNLNRSLPVTVLAASVAMGAAACGSSGSTDPLAGLSSQQIATKAVSGTEVAPSVRVSGSGLDSGVMISIDLTEERGKGCEGTIGEGNKGSLRMIDNGSTLWIFPDSKFYQANGAPAAVATLLEGKYLKLSPSTGGLASLSDLCSVSKLLSQFTVDAGTAKGVVTTVDGQTAVKISDKTGSGHAYVTDTAAPELLRIQKPGSGGGQIDFSYPAPAAITPPPASEVIDGSKYGF